MSRILIIGSGGREHALAWKASTCKGVETVFVAPGNGGTELDPALTNVDLDVMDFRKLADFVAAQNVALTIVGPEAPLAAGIVDYFSERGLRCFGPHRSAAMLEASKSYAKDFLVRHNIPTGGFEVFSEVDAAHAWLAGRSAPFVIKADGLAAGKGVVIAADIETARDTVRDMLSGNAFGEAGHRVVIEDFLDGEEASFIVLSDGNTALPFASSQDHKRIGEADTGPNTGGVGAYSPAPVVTPTVHQRIMREIIEPTLQGMRADGHPYIGFLYAGLMIDADGAPRVIEFNCRFGDPETQPVMLRLESDLVALCQAALDGNLAGQSINFSEQSALAVVMTAGGYPDQYASGQTITGADAANDANTRIFHAGTRLTDGRLLTAGGRVLSVTSLGADIVEARDRAYAAVAQISWQDEYHRNDIGYRAILRHG